MLSRQKINQIYYRDTAFVQLMTRRIFNVLLIANPYDAFMLEDDGRIDEKLFNEYAALGLRYAPRFTLVSSEEEVREAVAKSTFDLVIVMPSADSSDVFDMAREIKGEYPDVPLVVLTPFSHGITARMEHEDLSIFEYVFCWLGNTDLLLSIIKLIEDKMNLENDVHEIGVQMILLVEDGIRFYSAILPELYKFVLQQSYEFATEALNDHQRTLRMRGRPKIVLARSYDEAIHLYEQYSNNVLGIISDARFPMTSSKVFAPASPVAEADKVADAGVQLLRTIRESDPFVPLILESSEVSNEQYVAELNASFIDKNSKKMVIDLREAVRENLGFGDLVFRNPQNGEEVVRCHNLRDLQNAVFNVPAESFRYHIERNHISRWLRARALFPPAEFIKQLSVDDFENLDDHRHAIFEAIVRYRRMKNQGVVAVFSRDQFDRYSNFARIGEGSLGGKGRGLAFIDNMVKRHPQLNADDNLQVRIPKTVVLCTDVFEHFMEQNNLYPLALSDASDNTILAAFRKAELPDSLHDDCLAFIEAVNCPIAIRSSSLLEDSHYQPFAGIYSTYMVPYLEDREQMLRMLSDAIKSVYASVYYHDSKEYMTATRNVIDQEKMAVILQEVVGTQHGTRYYPAISGVGRSLNYYPLGDERAEDGIVNMALGLGKYVVDGGQTLRVCPAHPEKVLQMSDQELALRETQTRFLALDLTQNTTKPVDNDTEPDDGWNLLRLPVREADKDGALQYIASTFLPEDQMIYPGLYPGGRKIISFVGVLEHNVLPLPHILREVLRHGQDAMRRPVEIEFAMTIDEQDGHPVGTFHLLQIRPMVDVKTDVNIDLSTYLSPDATVHPLLASTNSLGHGIMDEVRDIIYVKSEGYNPGDNITIADEVASLNASIADGTGYLLVGPGRWGSSDPWLGIPVKWPHIAKSRVIVETAMQNYHVDPSQGTHFFQNLTSFGVGYITMESAAPDDTTPGVWPAAERILNTLPAIAETAHVRHVQLTHPLTILMDGKKKTSVILLNE